MSRKSAMERRGEEVYYYYMSVPYVNCLPACFTLPNRQSQKAFSQTKERKSSRTRLPEHTASRAAVRHFRSDRMLADADERRQGTIYAVQ